MKTLPISTLRIQVKLAAIYRLMWGRAFISSTKDLTPQKTFFRTEPWSKIALSSWFIEPIKWLKYQSKTSALILISGWCWLGKFPSESAFLSHTHDRYPQIRMLCSNTSSRYIFPIFSTSVRIFRSAHSLRVIFRTLWMVIPTRLHHYWGWSNHLPLLL